MKRWISKLLCALCLAAWAGGGAALACTGAAKIKVRSLQNSELDVTFVR